jgi:hypothetical protein
MNFIDAIKGRTLRYSQGAVAMNAFVHALVRVCVLNT